MKEGRKENDRVKIITNTLSKYCGAIALIKKVKYDSIEDEWLYWLDIDNEANPWLERMFEPESIVSYSSWIRDSCLKCKKGVVAPKSLEGTVLCRDCAEKGISSDLTANDILIALKTQRIDEDAMLNATSIKDLEHGSFTFGFLIRALKSINLIKDETALNELKGMVQTLIPSSYIKADLVKKALIELGVEDL